MLYFPPVWKHTSVFTILKPGEDPVLPSSYRPIRLLDTTEYLFEIILPTMIVNEVRGHWFLHKEKFCFKT